jgi:ADP-ribosyl-[dinitrogen reductase] hydrolase
MERFVRWWRDGENSVNGFCFDIGAATRSALERYRRDKNPIAGSTNSNSGGNGSLMRLAPVALLWVRNPEAAMDAARRQSATTHRAPAALEAGSYFAALLVEGITSGDKSAVLAPRSANEPAVRAVALGSWNRDRDTIRSSGYVIDTLEAALWSVSRAQSFAEAVSLAVNLGDDADTVAAVTGQLAGAIWGRAGIPQRWLDVLAQRARIEDLGQRLLRSGRRAANLHDTYDFPRKLDRMSTSVARQAFRLRSLDVSAVIDQLRAFQRGRSAVPALASTPGGEHCAPDILESVLLGLRRARM